jgi:FTR1 family protein
MFEALVIVLREGVEAALVLAIVLAYLRKTGRSALAPWVYAGVGLALVASVAGATALQSWKIDEEAFEGALLLGGAACVITLVIWMNRAAKGMKREIESRVERATTTSQGAGWGLLVFCALMILREGIETVVFLAATSFTSSGLARLTGAAIGLLLAALFAFYLVRGTLKIELGKFFRVTTIVLYVLAFQLIVGGLHELSESGILPSSRAEMALVGPIVRHDTHIFIVALVLAIAFVALASRPKRPAGGAATAEAATAATAAPAGAASDNAAAQRLARAEAMRDRRGRIGALATGLVVIVLLTAGILAQPGAPPKAQATPATVAADGAIHLDAAPLEDGRLHFFETDDPQAPGAKLRFFAIKKPDGALQACMDACEICGDLGYYQDAEGVTCRNCSAPINLTTLGQTGGCNPIPLVARRDGASFDVDAASIYAKRTLAKGKR